MAPQASRPSSARRPGFRAIMVTVTSANTVADGAWPVWAERPLGTSAATTRAPEPLTTSIQMSKGVVGLPWKPVPRMASTTTSASVSISSRTSRGGATTTGTPASTAPLATMRARSLLSRSGGTAETTVTSTPEPRSSCAATQPSPPLLPIPHRTTTRETSSMCRTSCDTALPARCMSSETLTPSRVSARSTDLTSSTLRTGCITRSHLLSRAPFGRLPRLGLQPRGRDLILLNALEVVDDRARLPKGRLQARL